MNKLQKFNEMKDFAVERGFDYNVHVLVKEDNIAWTSHYATLYHREFLKRIVGEKALTVGQAALELAFEGKDAVNYVYQQFLAYKGELNAQETPEESLRDDHRSPEE